jgi:hypothetical protein
MQGLLFHGEGELRDMFDRVKLTAKNEIDDFETNYLLNTSEGDLVRYLVDKYSLDPPILSPDNKYIYNQSEVDIDVSQDPMRAVFDRSRPCYVKGISITIAIPFSGNGAFFRYIPSSFTLNPPRGEIVGQEVHLIYRQIEHNADELNREISRRISDIQQYLGWVKRDIDAFNRDFESFVRDAIRQKKAKILKDLDLVSKLGIPIKKREDLPKTYVIPEIKKRPKIERPISTEKPYALEPELELEEYENILSIIRAMALVMEKSPHAYEKIKEEDLRFHFLFHLNGHYEGIATGETFNYQGKTDILIRYEGKNVFIAECKYWKGEKGLSETIDQLLRYTSWRDTKTAILLFNRGKNFSAVLEKIPAVVKSHSCFKREVGRKNETEFRYVLHQPDDPNRELILTILVFNVPVSEKTSTKK